MIKNNKKKFQYGDVFHIPVEDRYAYCQYTYSDITPPYYGDIIHVLPGIFDSTIEELEPYIEQEAQFCVFTTLSTAVKPGLLTYDGNYSVPHSRNKFPLFKGGNEGIDGKTISVWWLWDGETECPIGQLKKSQYCLPNQVNSNLVSIVDKIKNGYRPEDDVTECTAGQPLPEKLKDKYRDQILKLAPYLFDEE